MADEDISHLIRPPPNTPLFQNSPIPASPERLAAPHSRVTVTNTSPVQTHIVIDRFNNGQTLAPGEKREFEMLNVDIASFQDMRRTDRFFPPDGSGVPKQKPIHPILVEGIALLIDDVAAGKAAEQTARASERRR